MTSSCRSTCLTCQGSEVCLFYWLLSELRSFSPGPSAAHTGSACVLSHSHTEHFHTRSKYTHTHLCYHMPVHPDCSADTHTLCLLLFLCFFFNVKLHGFNSTRIIWLCVFTITCCVATDSNRYTALCGRESPAGRPFALCLS